MNTIKTRDVSEGKYLFAAIGGMFALASAYMLILFTALAA